ncbi:unnamed protein product [Ectocarpus sp. 12 AP-2014]
MSSPLALYATVMAFIFSSFCSTCSTAASLGTRRMATKRRKYNKVFSAAFLCSSSSRDLSKSVIATRSSPACRQQGLHRAATTNSLTPWVDRSRRQARASAKCNNLFSSSSSSSSSTAAAAGCQQHTPAPCHRHLPHSFHRHNIKKRELLVMWQYLQRRITARKTSNDVGVWRRS